MRSFFTSFFILSWGALRVAWGRPGGVLGAFRGDVACLGGVLGSPWGVWGVSWGPRRCMIAPRQHQDLFKTASSRFPDGPRSPQEAAGPPQDGPRRLQEGDISADLEARCSFHQISWNVLKVLVFQYFWGSPSPLRVSWWHLEASWALPGPTWRLWAVSSCRRGASWGHLGGQDGPRPSQDRLKITTRPPVDGPKICQDRHNMAKIVSRGRHEGLSVVF